MFEFHLVDVEATRPDAFEGDRLQCAKPVDQRLNVLGLRARRLGEFGRHPFVCRLFTLQFADLGSSLRLATGEGFLIVEALGEGILQLFGGSVVDAFGSLVAPTLVKDEALRVRLWIHLEGDLRVDHLVKKLVVTPGIDSCSRLTGELDIELVTLACDGED
ncbi:MAG TPA: hypothetical protein VFG04_15635, partial [Planctomycetaceae bacterium]|nr:hypothetical protein [Planctomycetaceae bacterium]